LDAASTRVGEVFSGWLQWAFDDLEVSTMSIQNILEQLLRSGTQQFESAKRSGDLGKYATGAAAGGALAMLLGSRRGRGFGGQALKLGSIAAVGALAWKVYQEHQARQQAPAPAAAAPRFEALPAPALEDHSRAMLKAMIAAAKSDGHMDERERELVEVELKRLDSDPSTRQWVEAELRRPVEPADVAAAAHSPEMRAEVYLASALVADETTTMERAYLDELAKRLELAPELRAALDAKARAG
jgi:uncharacterized membrane protein YebE (DUF533 family)